MLELATFQAPALLFGAGWSLGMTLEALSMYTGSLIFI